MVGYSSFSLKSVKKNFQLQEKKQALFADVKDIAPSAWLIESLQKGHRVVSLNNEKSRSEFIVAPIMSEIADKNLAKISFFSGENLDADKEQSLNGECDFIMSSVPDSSTVDVPIFCMVECESDNLMGGTGQCVAQMIGAQLINEREGATQPYIFGCVTTGNDWKFMKLEGKIIFMDTEIRYLENVASIIGIFQNIIDQF